MFVAPYAGAWIEILGTLIDAVNNFVAPYAGAWIEMQRILDFKNAQHGRSLRGSVD